jgi:hypothetical protein
MQPQHTNPADAVQIHQDVRSKKSIGIHCCTFNLTTGTPGYSVRWAPAAIFLFDVGCTACAHR